VIKTQTERYADLEQRIRTLHPYQVCEVLALDVSAGSQPYVDWVLRETAITADPSPSTPSD